MSGEKFERGCSAHFKIISFAVTAGLILFAFIHSSMPSEISATESGSVLGFLENILKSLNLEFALSEHFIRKVAHFTEYSAIGAMLMICAYSFDRIKPLRFYSQMLFVGLAAAVTDETIQLNVPGRSGQITDVLLDFSGVLTGILILFAFFKAYKRIKKRRDAAHSS